MSGINQPSRKLTFENVRIQIEHVLQSQVDYGKYKSQYWLVHIFRWFIN